MIDAKQAKAKTENNRVANFRKEVEKLINHSIEKGRDDAKISGTIPPDVVFWLMELGYSVEEQKGLTVVRW